MIMTFKTTTLTNLKFSSTMLYRDCMTTLPEERNWRREFNCFQPKENWRNWDNNLRLTRSLAKWWLRITFLSTRDMRRWSIKTIKRRINTQLSYWESLFRRTLINISQHSNPELTKQENRRDPSSSSWTSLRGGSWKRCTS